MVKKLVRQKTSEKEEKLVNKRKLVKKRKISEKKKLVNTSGTTSEKKRETLMKKRRTLS